MEVVAVMHSMQKFVVFFLVVLVGLLPSQAAATELAASILKAAKDAAAAQARPNASGNDENPYFLPGVILLGVGGLVAVVGMTHETGVECAAPNITSIKCSSTKSKGTIIAGAGIAAVGGYLLLKGNQRKRSPEIIAGPHVLAVRHHLRW